MDISHQPLRSLFLDSPLMFMASREGGSCGLRLPPFSQGRIYYVRGRGPNFLRFNKVMGDSQGLRGANLKILGHGEDRWNLF
jgi:hypothetical protein